MSSPTSYVPFPTLLTPTPPVLTSLARFAHCLPQICPWCYIGQREMERAIEMCKDVPVSIEIEYRPYRIYPSLKDGQFLDKREWYESRFGKEKVETMEKMAVQRAEQLGITM